MHAFTAPPLVNYHENRRMEPSISKNIDELKLASNRFKRYLAIKSILTYQFSDFLNFKYPKFSSMIIFLTGFYLVFFSFFSFIFFLTFVFLIYLNPFLKGKINAYLLNHFFAEKFLNQDFVTPKHLSNSWLEKYRTAEISSLDKKSQKKGSI